MIDNNTTVYVGIDPGKTGAIALITRDLQTEVYDYPEDVDNCAALVAMLHARLNIKGAVIEKVNAMPKQGVVSMFNFGGNFFAWRAMLASFAIPYQLVTPQKWRKAMLDSGGGDDLKAHSLNMARRLFPNAELNLKKHDGRAEALHLARYALQAFCPVRAVNNNTMEATQ